MWTASESVDGEMLVHEEGSDTAIAAVFPLDGMRPSPYTDLIVAAPETRRMLALAVARKGFSETELIAAHQILENLKV